MSTAATRAPERIAGSAPPVGRRVAARRRLAVPLNVTVLRSGVPDAVPGRSVDVCEGGIGAVLAGELFPGELVGVEFHLPKSGPVLAKARVCYQERLRCGLQFLAIPAEQKAMIESWTNQGQESTVPVAPVPPQSSVPKATAPNAQMSSLPRSERPRTERPASPAAPTFAGYSATPRRRPSSTPRYMRHKVVMLLVASVIVVVGMGWWRWEEGWRELESRLPGHTVEQPQATVPSEVMLRLLVHTARCSACDRRPVRTCWRGWRWMPCSGGASNHIK
jgi:hypothetical protein